MTDILTVENAGMLMIFMIAVGVILALVVAPQVDFIITTMKNMGFDAGAGSPWSDESEFWSVHNILIVIIYCPGPMGIIIFLISVTRRNRRDNVSSVEGYEAGSLYYAEE
jgi:hypothetical protein